MNRFLTCFLVLACLLQVSDIQAQDSPIKILQGNVDTTYNPTHVIIGLAQANDKISINGEKVHVYKTGTFGKEVQLSEGENIINISKENNNPDNNSQISSSISLKVFYSKEPKKKLIDEQAEQLAAKKEQFEPINKIIASLDDSYLNSSCGGDRLGGTKINFIDKDIYFNAIAQNNNFYKVQLSKNRYAYIPKSVSREVNSIEELSKAEKILSKSTISGSATVVNTGSYDKLAINIPNKKPYIVKEYSNPHRIVIDLFGVECNSNWLTHYSNLQSIDNVNIENIDSDITRLTVYLKTKTSWGFKISYTGNYLSVEVKHIPNSIIANKNKKKPNILNGLIIGVDAGHGGNSSSGAVGHAGYKEKEQNLSMAYILKQLLESQGAKVVLTRDADIEVSMKERKEILKNNNVDLLISIHCNAGGSPLKTGGASTYYRYNVYKDLAQAILARILEIDGVQNFGMVGNFNFSLNAPIEYPSVLVETLFMSNLWDEEHITDKDFQKQIMQKVVTGLKDYLRSCAAKEY